MTFDPKVLIPLIRKHIPKLIAQEIVGVQPMNIPTPVPDTWQTYLLKLQIKYASWTKLGQECDGDGLADATKLMQLKFPGQYRVVEKFDPTRGTFSLDLEFDDPKQKIFWLIKWS